MELLAPAGTLEAGIAALTYGADAVYLGLQDFSARADAGNFSPEDLRTLLGLAHEHGDKPRKVYVTVNTLLREDEQPRLLELLQDLGELSVDALIIQDWGVYQLVREHFPHFELHASTQLAVHDVHGALAARDLGFSRVVLARELTLPEIARISDIPGLQTEVFAHGALCYAYSGLCCLSAALRGPSGNRGSCDYICRGCFKVKNGERVCGNANIMSMKDLATPDLIPQLKHAKVASLKIEGRKKTPLYVAATVNFYRHLLDGTQPPQGLQAAESDVKTIFSRPWTPFHLRSRKQPAVTDIHTVGHRGTEAGIITDVIEDDFPHRLRFTVRNTPLEKHDGLQVELPGRDRPFGFPINDIRIFPQRNNDTWENAFVAQPGATVEVTLPEEHPDLPAGARLFRTSSQAVKRAYDWEMPRPALCKERFPVSFTVSVSAPAQLQATATLTTPASHAVTSNVAQAGDEPFTPARQPERADDAIRSAFAKLGDTDFRLQSITVDNPEHLFVPASQLNLFRRGVTDALEDELSRHRRHLFTQLNEHLGAPTTAPRASASPRWTLCIDRAFKLNLLQQDDFRDVEEIVFSLAATPEAELADELATLDTLITSHPHLRLRLALPPIIREGAGNVTASTVNALVQQGRHLWQAANIGHRQLLRQAGLPDTPGLVTADWTLFATNSAAIRALLQQGYATLTLAPDDAWDNWMRLLPSFASSLLVPVFSDFPLAISDACAMASLQGACPGPAACTFTQLQLDNVRKREERLLAINNRCQTIILNQKPLNLAGHLHQLVQAGACHFRADFCWRNHAPTTVRDLWRQLRADQPDPNAWTANLFRDTFIAP